MTRRANPVSPDGSAGAADEQDAPLGLGHDQALRPRASPTARRRKGGRSHTWTNVYGAGDNPAGLFWLGSGLLGLSSAVWGQIPCPVINQRWRHGRDQHVEGDDERPAHGQHEVEAGCARTATYTRDSSGRDAHELGGGGDGQPIAPHLVVEPCGNSPPRLCIHALTFRHRPVRTTRHVSTGHARPLDGLPRGMFKMWT